MSVEHPRRLRSFVRRPGRMTTGQRRALETLLPRWGIAFSDRRIDLASVFGRDAPRVLDIGFGDGEALISAAASHPDLDYLGIEVHEPGIGHLLVLIERAGLTNVRVIDRDAVDVIACMLEPASFAAVNLFFPDPWPKKRHHKRRIVQPAFAGSVARILEPGGLFHIATDWDDYARQVREVMAAEPAFESVDATTLEGDARAFRAPTKFESRGVRLGHEIVDLYYLRRAAGV